MKHIIKHLFFATLLAGIITGCDKKDELPFYKTGNAPVLSSSTNALVATPADSSNPVITFSWTDPEYATDSATNKYIMEIDSAGRNFSNSTKRQVIGVRSTSFTGKQINDMLIGYGLKIGTAYDMDVRITSSYGNNNDQYISSAIKLKMTPYNIPFELVSTKPGPFVISFSNKDEVVDTFKWVGPNYGAATFVYSLQYDLAGKNFSTATTVSNVASPLSLKGSDLNRYAFGSGIAYGATGNVDFRIAATVNGTQTVYSSVKTLTISPVELVSYLYLPGDYQGWNPGTAPKLASPDAESYEGYVNMTSANGFKMNNSPDWDHTNYGDGGPGKLSTTGGNLSLQVGYYLIKANTTALTWSSTLITTWGVIGDATPGKWDSSTPLVYDAAAKVWKATINFSGSGAFKFRANNGWDINLGGSPTYLEYNGGNINSPGAGDHVVTLDLSNPLKYTYTVQ